MITDDYLSAGTAHDADFERHHAPWNKPDAEPTPTPCAWCWSDTDNSLSDFGDIVCDACLVAHAHECGEWSSESIAASRRLNPDPSTC